MRSLKIEEIKRRSVFAVFALTSRTAFLQIISFLGTFLLTIFLSPEVFGVFFVVTAVVAFLNYFSDIGLAAALIQKKEAITETDLRTTFTIQQAIVVSIVFLVLFFSSEIARFYSLSSEGLWLFRALVITFFLSSLKTIPSVILERELEFDRLIIPQIVEVLFFYILAVYLAWKGWGIRSFTYAVLLRGIAGLVVIYLLKPWIPAFSISKKSAKKLLSFGIPFQVNSFLALIKDDLFTLYLGKILPFSQVGYVGWAKKWAEVPLRLIMDSIVRVTFPAYARLQNYPEKLGRAVNKALFFLSFFTFPLSVGLFFVITPFVFLIPKYLKWEPALPSFYLFVFSSVLAALVTPLTNALNSIGKIKVTLKLMLMWTVLTWTITPALIFFFGFEGVAQAAVLIGLTSFLVIWVAKRYLNFRIFENIMPAFLSACFMGVYLFLTKNLFTQTIFGLLFYIFSAGALYLTFFFLIFREKLLRELKSIFSVIRRE